MSKDNKKLKKSQSQKLPNTFIAPEVKKKFGEDKANNLKLKRNQKYEIDKYPDEVFWFQSCDAWDGKTQYNMVDECNDEKYFDEEELKGHIKETDRLPNYMKKYEEFWAEIVEVNGELDKDAVARELFDYSVVLHNCACIYDHVSGGKISKQFTPWQTVASQHDDQISEEMVYKSDLKDLISDYEQGEIEIDDLIDELSSWCV